MGKQFLGLTGLMSLKKKGREMAVLSDIGRRMFHESLLDEAGLIYLTGI